MRPITASRVLLAAAMFCSCAASQASATILYVDALAAGGGDGLSWGTAFDNVQDALSLARTDGTVTDVYVAEGVYYPDVGGGQMTGDRGATFELVDGVALRGGFAGDETSHDQRDPAGRRTTLSGDINTPQITADNSYHVIDASMGGGGAILDGFTITAGRASSLGRDRNGGGLIADGSSAAPTIVNCVFFSNRASGAGGGVYVSFAAPSFANCVFVGNRADIEGGGLYTGKGATVITNCTFHANQATTASEPDGSGNGGGGGLRLEDWSGACPGSFFNANIHNSIFWGNTEAGNTGAGSTSLSAQLSVRTLECSPEAPQLVPPPLLITYNTLEEWDGLLGGPTNSGADPMFISPLGDDLTPGNLDDNLRLGQNSPAINAGDATLLPADAADLDSNGDALEPLPLDADRKTRVVNVQVDHGAYEASEDCNNNGVLDEFDIASGTSEDCDTNGLPDECELAGNDCNGTGTLDACELEIGFSNDCNLNNVPDECELATGDCDSNGLLDECEIASLAAKDCDLNGVIDSCELASGAATDCNVNGLPDHCEIDWLFFVLENGSLDASSVVRRFDELTGASVPAAVVPTLGSNRGMTAVPDQQQVYVTNYTTSRLTLIDVFTGAEITTLVLDRPLFELAYDHDTGTLYGTGDAPRLFEIDLVTGDTTEVVDIPGPNPDNWVCLTYDSTTKTVLGASLTEQRLYFLDPNTSNGVPAAQQFGVGLTDLVVDHRTAEIYGTTDSGAWHRVDRSTGVATWVANLGTLASTASGLAALFDEDCDASGMLDSCEVAAGSAEDCNQNALIDECEVAAGSTPDANGNGTPDGCEDCNNNGVGDQIDLAGGTSDDCNGNVLPDECELAGNDCDANERLDSCDIADDPSRDCDASSVLDDCEGLPDCNSNGTPDECETLVDCNNNGTPDECETFVDCNSNGTPDECESLVDCNSNGTPDECESLVDCNNNGTPDACETLVDCNTNGTPDECETLVDCNSNGTPDECETFQDCDGNRVPDECEQLPDCNNNGEADACEMLPDCNTNGTPDECEDFADCNNNGLPDECDLATLDCDNSGFPDECDLAAGTSADCDASGVIDSCEIADGSAADANDNGVIDSCEDCNDNDRPDELDILAGTSADCNVNGVPDDCDLAAGTGTDINGNDVIDTCEDCNNNGVPDSLDINGGTSDDANGNTLPDECETASFVSDATGWKAAVDNEFSYAFDTFFPGSQGMSGSLAGTPAVLALDEVTLEVAQSNSGSAIRDGSLSAAVSDADLLNIAICRFSFDQPIYGFYTYFGSFGNTATVRMRLYSNSTLIREISRQNAGDTTDAYGQGFATNFPIDRIDFLLSGGDGRVLIGAYLGLADGEDSLGTVEIPGYAGPDGSTVQFDFALTTTPVLIDCNNNGNDDGMDIVAGVSADCNSNSLPDECEAGTADLNGDGMVTAADAAPLADCQTLPCTQASCADDPLYGDACCSLADIDQDGDVDLQDWALLLQAVEP